MMINVFPEYSCGKNSAFPFSVVPRVSFVKKHLWQIEFFPRKRWLRGLCEGILEQAESPLGTVEVSFLFADDDTISFYNEKYLGKKRPTNVLAFPTVAQPAPLSPEKVVLLGDILLAFETIKKESLEASKTFEQHLTHLLIHGFLHLLGYDHMEEEEAQKMEALETQILQKLNWPDPYEGDFKPSP